MKFSSLFHAIAITAAVILFTAAPVLAVSGIPGSPEFGIGLTANQSNAVQTGSQPITWVKVDISWKSVAPDAKKPADFTRFQSVNQTQKANGTALLISLQDPPSWAVGKNGPVEIKTLEMVDSLLAAFPNVTAIELFPEANTAVGWASTPNAAAYAKIFQSVQAHLNQAHSPVLLVAGGLKPVNTSSAAGINDLVFLQQLYDARMAASMPVLSIHLQNISSEPWQNPEENSFNVLRHYEQVRQVMLANQHSSGLIWVTSLSAQVNSATGKVTSSTLSSADWIQQALEQMQSQLFLGLVILPEK